MPRLVAKVQEFRALANFYAFTLSSFPLFWSQFWLLPNCILYFLFGYIPMEWTWENERNNSHHLKHAFGQMDSYVLPQSRGRDRGFWMVYATIMTFGMMSASHLGQNRWTWYLESKSRVLRMIIWQLWHLTWHSFPFEICYWRYYCFQAWSSMKKI